AKMLYSQVLRQSTSNENRSLAQQRLALLNAPGSGPVSEALAQKSPAPSQKAKAQVQQVVAELVTEPAEKVSPLESGISKPVAPVPPVNAPKLTNEDSQSAPPLAGMQMLTEDLAELNEPAASFPVEELTPEPEMQAEETEVATAAVEAAPFPVEEESLIDLTPEEPIDSAFTANAPLLTDSAAPAPKEEKQDWQAGWKPTGTSQAPEIVATEQAPFEQTQTVTPEDQNWKATEEFEKPVAVVSDVELMDQIYGLGERQGLSGSEREFLLNHLRNGNAMISLLSAESLMKHEVFTREVIESVVEALYGNDETIRLIAVQSLEPTITRMPEVAAELLLAKTMDDTLDVRRLAVLQLGGFEKPMEKVVARLKELITGQEPEEIRQAAEISLKSIAERTNDPSLLAARH
ncbi:MAG: hypothetical protein KDA78_06940, partial [Planctomycetaceae bacterium]|nr:hypothetical protein [Planctomycetaceae bacterium]